MSFLGLSVVGVSSGQSYFLSCQQLIAKSKVSKVCPQPKTQTKAKKKKAKGRPQGSKNKPYREPDSLSYQVLKVALQRLCLLLNKYLLNQNIQYLVLDGFYGNQHYLKLAQKE